MIAVQIIIYKLLQHLYPIQTEIAAFATKHGSSRNQHANCFIVIDNIVYDVTKYLSYHPAGGKIIEQFHNKDCTEFFYTTHKNPHKIINQILKCPNKSYFVNKYKFFNNVNGFFDCNTNYDHNHNYNYDFGSMNNNKDQIAIQVTSNNDSHNVNDGNIYALNITHNFLKSQFESMIRNPKYPCICAKTAIYSKQYTFETFPYYTRDNSYNNNNNCDKLGLKLIDFMYKQQKQWKNTRKRNKTGKIFQTFVACFPNVNHCNLSDFFSLQVLLHLNRYQNPLL